MNTSTPLRPKLVLRTGGQQGPARAYGRRSGPPGQAIFRWLSAGMGETAVLVLAGELDLYRAPAITDALEEVIGAKLDSSWFHKPSIGPPPSVGAPVS